MVKAEYVIASTILLEIVLSTNDEFLVSFKVVLWNFEVELKTRD